MSKGEKTRKEIVERALDLAGTVGLEGVSLGVLAADAGLSKSGLFAHFKSKEALQLEVLKEAIAWFTSIVILPALKVTRGEPRIRALFDGYMTWITGRVPKGGCIFMALSHEYDDRPGAVRDLLVKSQHDWRDTVMRVADTAIAGGQFRSNLDLEQFAYDFMGIGMAFDYTNKLLQDPKAREKAMAAFDALIERSRVPAGNARQT
jgi:AcrR family transcriptional regulator